MQAVADIMHSHGVDAETAMAILQAQGGEPASRVESRGDVPELPLEKPSLAHEESACLSRQMGVDRATARAILAAQREPIDDKRREQEKVSDMCKFSIENYLIWTRGEIRRMHCSLQSCTSPKKSAWPAWTILPSRTCLLWIVPVCTGFVLTA